MNANAEILLVRPDGSVVLQVRDNKPGITNPGLISTFGGQIEEGEDPLQAAVREINEETNLGLTADQLEMYRICYKTKEIHGEDWKVYYYVANNISEKGLEVYEGTGFTIIHDKAELQQANVTILLRQVLTDYFDGFRSFMLLPDIETTAYEKLFQDYYTQITADIRPSTLQKPVALACTGLVAAGKSTLTAPLAEAIQAARVSSDVVRERFFQAGYNFKEIRPFIKRVLDRLIDDGYNIFLDFNISTNIPIIDDLNDRGYRIFVVHANPPESFIKEKILSGNMKHELTFFTRDEHLYESMLGWRDEHFENFPRLKQKYGIWYEVDTSRPDLLDTVQKMKEKLLSEVA